MPSTAVRDCSIEQIISTLDSLVENQFGENSWLPESNIYSTNIISKINDGPVNPLDLKEYTTASSILHCTDGWTFLSRAFKSIIDGDIPSAVFFTYYSELRALMSLFGVNGIAVLNKKHYYFDSDSNANLTRGAGTHTFVRLILEEYIKNGSKSSSLLKWIKIGNHSIEEWLRATGHTPTFVMASFLSQWGIDFTKIRGDHNTRNEVSYRPHQLRSNAYKYSYKEYLERIFYFWELCEPDGMSGFNLLDSYILKKSLQKLFNQLPQEGTDMSNGDRAMDESYLSDFRDYIEKANRALGSPLLASQLNSMTSFETPVDHFLEQASNNVYDEIAEHYDVIPMLARALFLLRFSTAGVNHIITSVQLKKEDIGFWWKEYGIKYGFWNVDDEPDNFVDHLWPDVQFIIDEIKDKIEEDKIRFDNPKSINFLKLEETNFLTQLNKIPLWGFGI